MASSIFGPKPNGIFSKSRNLDAEVGALRQMVGGNPDAFMAQAMQTNPKFAEFVNKYRDKSPEYILADHGLSIGPFRRFL